MKLAHSVGGLNGAKGSGSDHIDIQLPRGFHLLEGSVHGIARQAVISSTLRSESPAWVMIIWAALEWHLLHRCPWQKRQR